MPKYADDQLASDRKRHVNAKIGLRVPHEVTEKHVKEYNLKGKPLRKTILLAETDYTIIRRYNDVFRGLYQYYKLAWNVSIALGKVKWYMEKSLVATLAGKHKISAKQVYQKYRPRDGENILVKVVQREGKKPLIATWGRISPQRQATGTLHDTKAKGQGGRTELEKRLLAQFCELCGSTSNIEVHHIRALKDIWKNPDKPMWEKVMIARKRKTLVVCSRCHDKIHSGRHDGRKSRVNAQVKLPAGET